MVVTHAVWENLIGIRHSCLQVTFADIGLGDAIGRIAVEEFGDGDFGSIQNG